jgi:hypothetical protein
MHGQLLRQPHAALLLSKVQHRRISTVISKWYSEARVTWILACSVVGQEGRLRQPVASTSSYSCIRRNREQKMCWGFGFGPDARPLLTSFPGNILRVNEIRCSHHFSFLSFGTQQRYWLGLAVLRHCFDWLAGRNETATTATKHANTLRPTGQPPPLSHPSLIHQNQPTYTHPSLSPTRTHALQSTTYLDLYTQKDCQNVELEGLFSRGREAAQQGR